LSALVVVLGASDARALGAGAKLTDQVARIHAKLLELRCVALVVDVVGQLLLRLVGLLAADFPPNELNHCLLVELHGHVLVKRARTATVRPTRGWGERDQDRASAWTAFFRSWGAAFCTRFAMVSSWRKICFRSRLTFLLPMVSPPPIRPW